MLKSILLYIESSLANKLLVRAKELEISRNELIGRIIAEWLKKEN